MCVVVFLMKQKVVLILYRVHVRHCADPSKASTEPSLFLFFLSRTLEAIDTPKEQEHEGSVEKIVNLKGLLKSPWTLMDDV